MKITGPILRRFVIFIGIVFTMSMPVRVRASGMGDWSGLGSPICTAMAIGWLVPKYTLSIQPGGRLNGITWSAPMEYHLGYTHFLLPSIAYYPANRTTFFRATYGVPIGLGTPLVLVPGIGGFASAQGSGPRANLQVWLGGGEQDGIHTRHLIGLFVGGAWERDLSHKKTLWEVSAGLETVLPIDMLKTAFTDK
jgi:hypothetical protein